MAIYSSALFYLLYGHACFPCAILFFVAERNDRSRASAKRPAGHSLHHDQSPSAVRNQELAPLLHDRREDGQWQNSHLEDLTEHPDHHAPQRRTWIQLRPCESSERFHVHSPFRDSRCIAPIQYCDNADLFGAFASAVRSCRPLHQQSSNNNTLTKEAEYLKHKHTQSIRSAQHQITRNSDTLYTFALNVLIASEFNEGIQKYANNTASRDFP